MADDERADVGSLVAVAITLIAATSAAALGFVVALASALLGAS